jgi:tripartite-type tricarboxylate transporter receptor subunit TctC
MERVLRSGLRAVLLNLFAFYVGTQALSAAETGAFYEGKQITVIVGNPSGGGYDVYARLLARHMGKYLPGRPAFLVQNMPGAGSINAAQHLANMAAKDGTAIGVLVPGAIFDPLIEGASKFRYQPGKLEYIGSADSGTRICFTSKQSGISTFDDARKTKVIVASTAPQSSATDYALFMNALAGTKFEVVLGYKGPAELLLAMERGEAAGVCALDSATVASIRPEWLEEGRMNLLVQAGLQPNPEIKAPSMWEFIKGEERAVAELIVSQQEFGRPFMAPPGTPPEALKLLRDAFNAALKDPELLAEAGKMKLGVSPKTGEEVAATVNKLYGAAPALVERARQILRP